MRQGVLGLNRGPVQISAADAKDVSDLTRGAMLKEMFSESDLSDGSGSEIWVTPQPGISWRS